MPDEKKIYLVLEAQNCCEEDSMWPIAAFTEEQMASEFIRTHCMSFDLHMYEHKLDPWVGYLALGMVPFELIVTKLGALKELRRIDYNKLEYSGKWSIVSQGIKIQIVATNQSEAMISASDVLETLLRKGRI